MALNPAPPDTTQRPGGNYDKCDLNKLGWWARLALKAFMAKCGLIMAGPNAFSFHHQRMWHLV